ncbi:FKBP12-associated protein [Malassezia nana]|uniref:FKBP12-associated protein n=1 Tax=Malassezia nana TaxID=180528 RepID=A0AAF0EM81_9BASI|nr:FKBP12-associated protein [Malassezia nana]
MVDAAHVPPPQAPIPAPAPSTRRPKSRRGRGGRNVQHERPAPSPATDSTSTPPTQDVATPPTNPLVSSTPSAKPARSHRRQKSRKPRESTKKPQAPAQEQPARARAPRRSFGAHLTVAEPATEAAPPPIIPEYADLRTRLTAELSSDDYDCAICYHPVLRKQPIWSCARCHAVLHLPCVRTWAERSVQQMEEHNRLHEDPDVREQRGHWRCPACQAVQETVPRTYRCWCGRVTQPRAHAVPHSCGSPCRRGCPWHGCAADVCHPGPCPPCAATVRVACYCGREPERLVRCSQWRATLSAEQAKQPLDALQRQGTISHAMQGHADRVHSRSMLYRATVGAIRAPCSVANALPRRLALPRHGPVASRATRFLRAACIAAHARVMYVPALRPALTAPTAAILYRRVAKRAAGPGPVVMRALRRAMKANARRVLWM